MLFDHLNEDNFLLFAIKYYENPQAVTKKDFDRDLNHFKYIKRLLKRYKNTGELKTHLLLNHFIILYNIFGEATTPMLFFKIEKDLWPVMKAFIIFLNKLPEYPQSEIHDIQVDLDCMKDKQDRIDAVLFEKVEHLHKDLHAHAASIREDYSRDFKLVDDRLRMIEKKMWTIAGAIAIISFLVSPIGQRAVATLTSGPSEVRIEQIAK